MMVEEPDLTGLILGVDLDGVCADFYARMREIAAEWFETEPRKLTSRVSYGLREWGVTSDADYISLHRFAVTQRNLFSSVPMIDGARKYLRMLSDRGVRIRIITQRLFLQYFHQVAVSQTVEWLDSNGIPYWDLCFMRDKEQVGADIYVEDSPENVARLRESGLYTICFANSTNAATSPPRAKGWKEVYDLVIRRTRSAGTPG